MLRDIPTHHHTNTHKTRKTTQHHPKHPKTTEHHPTPHKPQTPAFCFFSVLLIYSIFFLIIYSKKKEHPEHQAQNPVLSGIRGYSVVFCGIGWYWRVLTPHPQPTPPDHAKTYQTHKSNPQAEHFPLDQPNKRCYIIIAGGAEHQPLNPQPRRALPATQPTKGNPETNYKGERL